MRQITSDAYDAFKNNKRFKRQNTEVKIYPSGTKILLLHGNEIVKYENGEIFISHAGWATNTTKERLSPFVNRIRRIKDSIVIEEKVKLTRQWFNLNDLRL